MDDWALAQRTRRNGFVQRTLLRFGCAEDAEGVPTLPRKVSIWLGVYMIAFGVLNSSGYSFGHFDRLKTTGLVGILLGMLAAHVLLWSSVLDSPSLVQMASAIRGTGHTARLTVSDGKSVLLMLVFSLVVGLLIAVLAVAVYEEHRDGYRLFVQLQICVVFSVFWPGLMWLGFWLMRRWLHAEAQEAKVGTDPRLLARRVFQKIGFVLLLGSGVLQLPLLVFG